MILKYISSYGVEIDFSTRPFTWSRDTDVLDYNWEYSFVRNALSFGATIRNIWRGGKTYNFEINAYYEDSSDLNAMLNHLHETFEKDVRNNRQGQLFYNNEYINGFVISSKKDDLIEDKYVRISITFATGSPYWTSEEEYVYFPYETPIENLGFILPTKIPLWIKAILGSTLIEANPIAATRMLITFYGPCTDPEIQINGHTYAVSGTLVNGERYEIDQRNKTVTKIEIMGGRVNAFNLRGKVDSVFEPLKAGENVLYYDGTFELTIKLFNERSEPTWS